MICGNPNAEEKTTQECIDSLECLFKSYKKDSHFNYQLEVCNSPFNILKKKIQKLGQLEELEKELEIDLIIVFKILIEKKFWFKKPYGIFKIKRFYVEDIDIKNGLIKGYETLGKFYAIEVEVKLKDRGKTWALTREELL